MTYVRIILVKPYVLIPKIDGLGKIIWSNDERWRGIGDIRDIPHRNL